MLPMVVVGTIFLNKCRHFYMLLHFYNRRRRRSHIKISKMTDIRVESIMFRVAEVNSNTPDACSGGKTSLEYLGGEEGKGVHLKLNDNYRYVSNS